MTTEATSPSDPVAAASITPPEKRTRREKSDGSAPRAATTKPAPDKPATSRPATEPPANERPSTTSAAAERSGADRSGIKPPAVDRRAGVQPVSELRAATPPSVQPSIELPASKPIPEHGGAHRRRVRDRIARRLVAPPRQQSGVKPVLEPLLSVHQASHPKVDVRLLQRGYDLAEERHRGQLRKSGDPYITHPLAVATILAELGMDTTTLVAALLHDTVEDTGLTTEEVASHFGSEVAHLVEGVTKLDKVKYGEAAEAETIRKMIVAMSRDPRVLVIKLADRLHNMRTLRFLPPAKQERKARETLEVLAPLAHRLGMNTVKWELEDSGLRHPLSQALRRDRAAGRRPGAAARRVPERGHRAGQQGFSRPTRSRRTCTAGPSTITRSTRR